MKKNDTNSFNIREKFVDTSFNIKYDRIANSLTLSEETMNDVMKGELSISEKLLYLGVINIDNKIPYGSYKITYINGTFDILKLKRI